MISVVVGTLMLAAPDLLNYTYVGIFLVVSGGIRVVLQILK